MRTLDFWQLGPSGKEAESCIARPTLKSSCLASVLLDWMQCSQQLTKNEMNDNCSTLAEIYTGRQKLMLHKSMMNYCLDVQVKNGEWNFRKIFSMPGNLLKNLERLLSF